MTYVSEGLRAALVPSVPHIAPWICILVLRPRSSSCRIGSRGFFRRAID